MGRTQHGLPGIYNLTPFTLADGDGSALSTDANGKLIITAGSGATDLGKAEDSAAVSGDVGIMALGVQNLTMAVSAGTDGDYTSMAVDANGTAIYAIAPRAAFVGGTASVTDTTSTSVVASAGGSLKNYITDIAIANTGASTSLITIQDGSGGTALLRTIAPAGGGSNIHLSIPLVGTAATAVFFAAGTSSSTIYCTMRGYKAP